MRHLWAILLILVATLTVLFGMSGAGVAQPSDPQPREASSDDGPPPGGCTPIGVTVSGEVVFPMTCKDFIERYKAADRGSGAAETKPATVEVGKASTTGEAKAQATTDVSSAPAAAEANKVPAAAEVNKAPATADVSSAPAAVEAGETPTAVEASKAPITADPGKPDEKDADAAAAKAQADEATRPVTKQAAVAPANTVNSSAEPATTATVSKRTRARNRVAGSRGCTRFRTYDAASRTYRDYGGHRRSCP